MRFRFKLVLRCCNCCPDWLRGPTGVCLRIEHRHDLPSKARPFFSAHPISSSLDIYSGRPIEFLHTYRQGSRTVNLEVKVLSPGRENRSAMLQFKCVSSVVLCGRVRAEGRARRV